MAAKMTFESWKRSVDLFVGKLCGVSADDLPDAPYRDWYDRGTMPEAAAKKAIRLAKTY